MLKLLSLKTLLVLTIVCSNKAEIKRPWVIEDNKKLDYNSKLTNEGKNQTFTDTDHKYFLKSMEGESTVVDIYSYSLIPSSHQIRVHGITESLEDRGLVNFMEGGKRRRDLNTDLYDPIAIISGGDMRIFPAGSFINVGGGQSYERYHKIQDDKLSFQWQCTEEEEPPSYCVKGWTMESGRFIIPPHREDQITLFLRVSVPNKKWSATAKQIIKVKKDTSGLVILCEENCPPSDDYALNMKSTTLQVGCMSNCGELGNSDYVWTIKQQGRPIEFNYERNTDGRNFAKFTVKGNSLSHSTLYEFEVKSTKQPFGEAVFNIEYARPIEVKSCEISPKKGYVSITLFNFSCTQKRESEQNFYELYGMNRNNYSTKNLVTRGIYPEIQNVTFKLPLRDEFFLKIGSKDRLAAAEIQLDVTVTIHPETLYVEKLQNYYKLNITKDLQNKNKKKRLNAVQNLENQVSDIEEKLSEFKEGIFINFLEDHKFKVMEDMIKVPFDTIAEGLTLSRPVLRLVNLHTSDKIIPQLATSLNNYCLQVMRKMFSTMFTIKNSQVKKRMSSRITRFHRECIEIKSYYMKKPKKIYIVTTQPPDTDEDLIAENYDDYVDYDEEYYENRKQLQNVTFNLINNSMIAAKQLAMTIDVGEEETECFRNSNCTYVLKDIGSQIAQKVIETAGVIMTPSEDFTNDNHTYDVLMVTWENDILNWNPNRTDVTTAIVNCQFWHSNCSQRITHFQKPVNLFLDLKEDRYQKVLTFYSHATPNDTLQDNSNYRIKVHRITVPGLQNLRIKFHNITEDEIDVVLTAFKFPTIEDFSQSLVINKSNELLTFLNNNESYVICYLGILMRENVSEISYGLSSITHQCSQWSFDKNSWIPSCKLGEHNNYTVIHCKCNHFSIFAGHLRNVMSPLQEIIVPDLEMQPVSCHYIFSTVVLILGIYSLLLLLVIRKKKKIEVYYLSDNNVFHGYAYLVTIRTGTGFSSGTSSNVVIKLTGDKASSEPHVLNYPDPRMKILQRFGKDMFLLTTKKHLGNIKIVELWLDSVGSKPAWYCEYVMVYDIQERIEWFFKVNQRLSLKTNIYYSQEINEKNTKKKFARIDFRLSIQYHTWCLWMTEENVSYIKKLTVVLSTILTTFAVTLFLLGLPEMNLQDGFDEEYYIIFHHGLIAFLGSFPMFVLHLGIIWCFRCSQIQFSRYRQTGKLPFCLTIFCWLLLIILIIGSLVVLLIFGFWVPCNRSLIWLTCCGTGIIFGVFVCENIFNLLQNCFMKSKYKAKIEDQLAEICQSVETQRRYLSRHFGRKILRPYFQHLYTPLQIPEIKKKLTVLKLRHRIITELEDLLMFGVYVILLYVVILSEKDTRMVYVNNNLCGMMEGAHTHSMNYKAIETLKDIYQYINETLNAAVHPKIWYDNYTIVEPGIMIDLNHKYIGVVRLRQQRVGKNRCTVAEQMRFLNISCWPEFSYSDRQTGSFAPYSDEYFVQTTHDRLQLIWSYSSSKKTETLAAYGEITIYPGGGFVAFLGRTLHNSYANFRKMSENFWIDPATRVVFIEFLTYDVNYNLFSAIQLILEHGASGYDHQRINIYNARMVFVDNNLQRMSIACSVIFIIWILFLILRKSYGVIKNYRTFYKDLWTLMDIIIIVLNILCIAYYMIRMEAVGRYLEELEKAKKNQFENYFHLFYVEDFLTLTGGFLVCLSTVRLWKFLRFGTMFRGFEITIRKSAVPLISLSICGAIIVMAFSFPLLLLIGNYSKTVSHLTKMTEALAIRFFYEFEWHSSDNITAEFVLWIMICYVLSSLVFVSCFAILIIRGDFEAQMQLGSEMATYGVTNYVDEQRKYFSKLFKYKHKRLKGGDESKLQQKSDKFLYLHSYPVSTHKMKCMTYLAKCIFRNLKRKRRTELSQYDELMMLRVGRQFLLKTGEDTVEVFHVGRIAGQRIHLVDRERILKAAFVAELLLQDQTQESFEEKKQNPVLEQCSELIKKKEATLQRWCFNLKLLLHKMDNINLRIR